MYEKELMMAIITSSTALAGLSAVVVGQVVQSELKPKMKYWFRIFLTFTFLLAIIAVLYSITWLSSPEAFEKTTAIICFGAQLILFSTIVGVFWARA